MGAVTSGVGIAGDAGDAAGHGVGGGLGVVQGGVDEIVQAVQLGLQLLQTVGGELQGDVRGHLAHDAAHVLAALHLAAVDAACHVAVLAARDAAHVVAHMGIAHRAQVGAALQDAVGIARHAAGVGGDGVLLHVLPLQQGIDGALHVLQAGGQVLLADGGVHRRLVGAVQHRSGVLSGDAAGKAGAPHHAGGLAQGDGTAGLVLSGDATHIVAAHDDAGEGAVVNGTGVGTGDTAHLRLGAGGGNVAPDGQVLHHRAGLDAAEKAVAGGAVRQGEAVNMVALMRQMPMLGPILNCMNSMAARPPTVVRELALISGMARLRAAMAASRTGMVSRCSLKWLHRITA